MRIEGVDHIPKLIEKLSSEANETAEKIQRKVADAQKLSEAIRISALTIGLPSARRS
jgi:hypothetical protein